MLAAIYYGAMYGGSTTAILVNIPGEVASVVTTLDGYQMARQGRAGPALAIAAISSFVAGTLGLVGLTLLRAAARGRRAAHRAAGVLRARRARVQRGGESLRRLAAEGAERGRARRARRAGRASIPCPASRRFTFGTTTLLGGIDFIAVIIGLFAITEVLLGGRAAAGAVSLAPLGKLMPSVGRDQRCMGTDAAGDRRRLRARPAARAARPGAISFIAYDLERRVSQTPERFGKGAIEGVAAPEGANNATTSARVRAALRPRHVRHARAGGAAERAA